MIKTVIFDFDGTLADTLPICYYAFQQVFLTYDKREITEAEIKAMFGPSEVGILQNNLVNQTHIEDAISDYYHHYEEKHEYCVHPFEPVNRLLSDMREAGFQIAIFTGKGRRSLDISLNQLRLNGFFDVIITGDDVTNPKPNPQGLQLIMQSIGSRPEETVLLGDSDADIEAGKRVNVQSVRVQWLPDSVMENFHYKPGYVFRTVDECRRFLNLNE